MRAVFRQEYAMPQFAEVSFHPSQFPSAVRSELIRSLRSRQVNPKFHYDSVKQTQKWLALHEAYSPARTDPGCAVAYASGFAAASSEIEAGRVHVIGLGCGGGQKDTRLLERLAAAGKETFYTPCDSSAPMALCARERAAEVIPAEHCFPVVCDLGYPEAVRDVLSACVIPDAVRVITCFGFLPNIEPEVILPQFSGVAERDVLLLSANLAPGPDYASGVQRVLGQYDNAPTRDWLMVFLTDLGVEAEDGELAFSVDSPESGDGLKRIVARFRFRRPFRARLDSDAVEFEAGDALRLFYSYRHTPAMLEKWLRRYGLTAKNQWTAESGEEGVFLVARLKTGPSCPAPP